MHYKLINLKKDNLRKPICLNSNIIENSVHRKGDCTQLHNQKQRHIHTHFFSLLFTHYQLANKITTITHTEIQQMAQEQKMLGCSNNSVHFQKRHSTSTLSRSVAQSNLAEHSSTILYPANKTSLIRITSLPSRAKRSVDASFSSSWAILQQCIGVTVYRYHIGEDGKGDHGNGQDPVPLCGYAVPIAAQTNHISWMISMLNYNTIIYQRVENQTFRRGNTRKESLVYSISKL